MNKTAMVQQHESADSRSHVRHVAAGDGTKVWVVGDTYTFKATGDDTAGRLFVWVADIPPAAGPPPHIHLHQDEAYYLLDGELEVSNGDSSFTARAGSFVYIPRGTVHCFRNSSKSVARMLVWMTPAGFEQFFLEVGQPARPGESAPPLCPEEMAKTLAAAPKYGMELRLPDASSPRGR